MREYYLIIKRNKKKVIFTANNKVWLKPKQPSQPPKNNKEVKQLIKIIFAYSPKKNNAKAIEEYSTL